jgi:hypothetical protein
LCGVIIVVTEFMANRLEPYVHQCPSVLCGAIGVVAEFMVRMHEALACVDESGVAV